MSVDITKITSEVGRHRRRKRVGHGHGSGRGKTCGRGHKGCGARAGGAVRPLTEGGQMPLFRRLRKRGFNNANFRRAYSVVNVGDLDEVFEVGARVTVEAMRDAGLIRNLKLPVKVLGDGALSKKLTVEAHKFSKQALDKIGRAGGEAKTVSA